MSPTSVSTSKTIAPIPNPLSLSRLASRIALITGAGSGFGESIAKTYALEGATVFIADINTSGGTRVAAEINAQHPGRSEFIHLDVTSKSAWTSALSHILSTHNRLDILVNNAGTTYAKSPSHLVSESDFDTLIAVNIKSLYLSLTTVLPYFIESGHGGVVVNTSSVAGTKVREGQVWYGATKAYMDRVTQGIAAEYGGKGVRINSVCPVRGRTGLLEKFSGVEDSEEERGRFGGTVPLGRMAEPQDVANAAVFLASDEAAFITGIGLAVDGGRLCV